MSMEHGDRDTTDPLARALSRLPRHAPREGVRARFDARMRAAQAPLHRSLWRRARPAIAALAATVVLVAGRYYFTRNEHRSARDGLVASAWHEEASAGARLEALHTIPATSSLAADSVMGLLERESSTHVRVAAVRVLGRVASVAELPKLLTKALARERSPFVQLALLSTTSRVSRNARRHMLDAFLTRSDIDPVVRRDATWRYDQ